MNCEAIEKAMYSSSRREETMVRSHKVPGVFNKLWSAGLDFDMPDHQDKVKKRGSPPPSSDSSEAKRMKLSSSPRETVADCKDEMEQHKTILSMLEQRISSKMNNNIVTGMRQDKNQKLAQALEKVLRSTTASSTSNITNAKESDILDQRLYKVADALLQRRLRHSNANTCNRETYLRELLGMEMAEEVTKVVDKIKELRLARVSRSCGSCNANGCSIGLAVRIADLPKNEKMPSVVKNLFFQARVVNAFDQMSTSEWKDLDWNTLLSNGQQCIKEYEDWIAAETTKK